VLIPRPETELLVEKILTMACLNAKVLDIGTGSGCIPISLLKNRPDLSVLASDISPKSLETAWRNKKSILPLACPLEFICSNLFEDIPLQQFNIIVSNPPYLSLQDYAVIASELSYEPPEALTDHGDGLSFYRQIAEKASQYLCHKGLVFLEIGFSQEKAVCEIFQSYLCKDKVKDSNGFIRVLVFEKDF
jgi:release factor glutamine methyltransferase